MFSTKPPGTISPTSLRPHQHQPQPRIFQTSHSFPLTSHPSTALGGSSFASNAATIHPSEYLDRHAPIPEEWVIQLPSSPSAPSKFQPEVSLLIPDYDGLEEGDARLLRAASAMLAENDSALLAEPHLIDFNSQSQSQSQSQPTFQRGPFRSWNSQPLQVVSPLRIHPYTRRVIKDIPTSSPDSDQSFDTPLSERQRRRREQGSTKKRLCSIENSSGRRESMGEETFYGLNGGDEQHTPTPIRFAPLVRSTSKFSLLDDDDDEPGKEVGRELWSPELVDMEMDVGMKEVGDPENEREREASVVTVVLSTPIKEISSASKGSEFELDSDVKDDSDEEDYPSSPFHPTPIKRTNRRHSIATTPLKLQVQPASSPLEDGGSGMYGTAEIEGRRRGERNEKGYKKAEEFRMYLDGERSARDPRFDLKVFHWILTGCPEMQWSSTGYGIEIKDISAFYQNVLHKEAREKRESTGKTVSKRDLPGKSSFERQLSGYGFKRVTTGKFMTIERPDLRRDNHDLLRKVQEVWQVIEEGSMMPKVKVEKPTTTNSLRTQVRKLQSEVIEKNTKLEEMKRMIKGLIKGEIVSPSKFHAIGIHIHSSPADSGTLLDIDMNFDPELVTPLQIRTTRSKNTTATATVKPIPKTKSKKTNNTKRKVIAKSTKPKLQIKSTNILPSPPYKLESKSKSKATSKSKLISKSTVQEESTPIKSIAELIKEGKRGRGKKRV